MLSRKVLLLCLCCLGAGMPQATLSEAACAAALQITGQPIDIIIELGQNADFTLTADAGANPSRTNGKKVVAI